MAAFKGSKNSFFCMKDSLFIFVSFPDWFLIDLFAVYAGLN